MIPLLKKYNQTLFRIYFKTASYGLTGYSATDDRISCMAVGQEPSCNGMSPFQPATSSDSLWCKYLQTGDAQFARP
ncbi:MAG: hypothetical protein U5N85_04745 [Arcicella sp.]|nr:hypothetical protein [Arcicella sp.]